MPSNHFRAARAARSVSLGLALYVGTSGLAHAIDDCLTQPNLKAGGGHWYYRIDRTTHRKCWYQEQAGAKMTTPAAPPAAATATVPGADSQGGIVSAISSMFGAATTPNASARETKARATETAPDDQPKRQTVRTRQSDFATAPPSRSPRQSSRPSQAKAQEPAKTAAEETDRDALFLEFLLWRQGQRLSQ
jgi:hypothetical protein